MSKKVDKINVRVAVRVRPMNDKEKADNSVSVVRVEEKKMMVTCKAKSFSAFDKVYGPSTSQERIYAEMVSPQVERVLAGYNCTLFAYGQTGTGKTYTMEGGNGERSSYRQDPSTGIIPRAVEHIFEELEKSNTEEYSVRVSYLELYNEELFDLLAATTDDRERLRIFDDPSKKGMVVISGAEELPVRDRSEVYALLKRGAEKRTTAATLMNLNSSRSHSIFTVSVVIRENTPNGEELVKQGKLNLVDLAGSEHIGRSGAEGKRAKEAGNINQSLLTLGRVITALTTSAPHVPYRESKLTRLLQDSLGGSTITSIIATLSPASCNYEESISTLEYAARAKSIRNHPECNQKLSRKALLKEYNEEIEKLRRDLRTAREKNGIFLSQESYEGMEQEIAVKTEQLRELEGQLDVAIGKLQKFIEDQELMDEQYRELYHRNKRLEDKLRLRVDELDDTKKELATTTDRLHAIDKAFEDTHKLATRLYLYLKETREMVFDQQLEIEDWWTKEEYLSDLIAQNKQVIVATRSKILSEILSCSSAISSFVESSSAHREQVDKAIGSLLYSQVGKLDGCNDGATNASEILFKWVTSISELLATVAPKILESSNCLAVHGEERLTQQTTDLGAMVGEVLNQFAVVGEETSKLTSTLQELRKQSDLMLEKHREYIEEDRQHRVDSIDELRKQQQRTQKIVELAQAIIAESQQYDEEREDVLKRMESHGDNTEEKNKAQIEAWDRTFSAHEDAMQKSISLADGTAVSIATLVKDKTAAVSKVLKETAATVLEMDVNVKEGVENLAAETKAVSNEAYDAARQSVETISKECGLIKELIAESEATRKEGENKQVMSESSLVRDIRHHHGEMNKEVLAMVEENWLSPKQTGKTPQKRHHPVAKDSEIPHVPKKDKILVSKGYNLETPKRANIRTRESLLEVQNICLSPDSLMASRKTSHLENIKEEPSQSSCDRSNNSMEI
ncbi:hypothetical protein Q1695_013061 [Nippostrongylus brasiliensis]|nr:hypothetical protein Q1695_013061 [Nippostrongylus brasiliensis]